MEKEKTILSNWFLLCVIMMGVTLFWRLLEVLIDGHIQESQVDTIIGLVLCFSIYKNIKLSNRIQDLIRFNRQREEERIDL